jgi:streptomycin 6-kinase
LELKKWTSGLKRLRVEFDGGSGPFPEPLVARAEGLCLELLASMPASTLLHGDLHYWNILSAKRESWLAIDPKGIVGDPAFEPAAWLLNPKPRSLSGYDLRRQLERRIDLFSMELGLERQRIIGWGSTLAALSAWWSYEDHGCGWELAIEVAEQLAKLK